MSETRHDPPPAPTEWRIQESVAPSPGSSKSIRHPWDERDRTQRVLQLCASLFGPWLRRAPFSADNMRASKFERRVVEALGCVGVDPSRIVREVVLPLQVDHGVRKFIDSPREGQFQRADDIPLRLDLVWTEEGQDETTRLCIVEVDGSQHGAKDHFFFGSGSSSRAAKRDDLKGALIRAAAGEGNVIRFLRIGPEYERDTSANRTGLLRLMLAFTKPNYANKLGIVAPEPHSAAPATLPHQRVMPGTPLRAVTAPPDLPRPAPPLALRRAQEEESQRKLRTVYNRLCKEKAKGRPDEAARLERIKARQQASDSRKRPRDDTGAPHDPKWFRVAREVVTHTSPTHT